MSSLITETLFSVPLSSGSEELSDEVSEVKEESLKSSEWSSS